MDFEISFAQLEAILAVHHDVADHKRSAFQARLKNLQRLGLVPGVAAGRGRSSAFGAGEVVKMALAVELLQLGLPPERAVRLVRENGYPLSMGVGIAARELRSLSEHRLIQLYNDGDGVPRDTPEAEVPLPMFIYFDTAALSDLIDDRQLDGVDLASITFSYAGIGIVQERLADWTSGRTPRVSFINVTTVLLSLASLFGRFVHLFLDEISSWAENLSLTAEEGGDGDRN